MRHIFLPYTHLIQLNNPNQCNYTMDQIHFIFDWFGLGTWPNSDNDMWMGVYWGSREWLGCFYKETWEEMVSATNRCWHIWIPYWKWNEPLANVGQRGLRKNPSWEWNGRSIGRNTGPWWHTWTAEWFLKNPMSRLFIIGHYYYSNLTVCPLTLVSKF